MTNAATARARARRPARRPAHRRRPRPRRRAVRVPADRRPRADARLRRLRGGAARGVAINELAAGADVNDLLVTTRSTCPSCSTRARRSTAPSRTARSTSRCSSPAHSKLRVPVSCVEQGRWDHRRHAQRVRARRRRPPHPELRRLKNERVRERLAAGETPRADQGEVWQEIAATSARHGARSDTGALHDVFEHRRDMIDRAAARSR